MTTKLINIFICFLIPFSFSFAQDNVNVPSSEIIALNIKIEGMHCAVGCARSIENELNNNEGIKATVDFNNSQALIAYNESLFSDKKIIDMINNYEGGKYKASLLNNSTPKCSKGKECCQRTGKINQNCENKEKGCCAGSKKKCKKKRQKK